MLQGGFELTYKLGEGGGSVSPPLSVKETEYVEAYFVLKSKPTSAVLISFSQDKVSGLGIEFSSPSLSFDGANWNVPQTVNVTATNDLDDIGNGLSFFLVDFSSADAYFDDLAANVTVTTLENDQGTQRLSRLVMLPGFVKLLLLFDRQSR